MKMTKNKIATTTMPVEYILILIVVALLIIWAIIYYGGLGDRAMQLWKEFF